MKVRATKRGFYGALREVGSVFEIEPADRGSWMEVVDVPKPTPKPNKRKPKKMKVSNGE
jgi:hypothetical protein